MAHAIVCNVSISNARCLATVLSILEGSFKFLNISTDEVYGSLELDQEGFTEMSPILPSSAYSASKASAFCVSAKLESPTTVE